MLNTDSNICQKLSYQQISFHAGCAKMPQCMSSGNFKMFYSQIKSPLKFPIFNSQILLWKHQCHKFRTHLIPSYIFYSFRFILIFSGPISLILYHIQCRLCFLCHRYLCLWPQGTLPYKYETETEIFAELQLKSSKKKSERKLASEAWQHY